MARQRMLHPDFFTDPKVVRCSMAARLLFQGLWCLADRDGRLEADPLALKMRVLPGDSVDIAKLLGELEREGLVRLYSTAGKQLAWLPGFAKRQRPHPKEPKSELPGPDTAEPLPAVKKHGETVAKPSESFPSESFPSESVTTLSADADPGEVLAGIWNAEAPPECPKVRDVTDKRKRAAKARWRDTPEPERWRAAIASMHERPFLRGQNDRGWVADFDWLLQPDTLTKLEEGRYRSQAPPRRPGAPIEPTIIDTNAELTL